MAPRRLLLALALALAAPPAPAEEHVEALSEAAARGSPSDQLELAVLLDAGIGMPRDRAQAILWFSRAALGGEPRAQHTLGQLFETGDGVPRNLGLARAWYAAAAPALPAAAERLEAVAPNTAADPAAEPAPPEILHAGRIDDGGAVEVIWSAPEQPAGTSYLVELRLADGRTAWLADLDRSAARIELPPEAAACCVRVVALDTGVGRYAASEWTALADGAALPPLVSVTLTHEGEAAESLAADLARDLEASGVPVRAAPGEAGETSAIVYFFETDRPAAEALAALLPSGFAAPERRDGPDPWPGRIEIRLAGG